MNNNSVLYVIILISSFYVIFMSEILLLTIGSFIISLITVSILVIKFIPWLKNNRLLKIKDLERQFLNQVVLTLRSNIKPYEMVIFSERLNRWYEISGDKNDFKKFITLRPYMGFKLKFYQNFCIELDAMIKDFRNKLVAREIITKTKTENGRKYMLIDKYKTYNYKQIDDLLEKEYLFNIKENIEQYIKKMPDKSKKLLDKIDKINLKWIKCT